MKNLLFIAALILVAGCSTSQPTNTSDYDSSDISGEKAAPAPGTPSTTMYTETVSKDEPAPTITSSGTGQGCKTPLGNIPDGGTATGYMAANVPTNEVCVSDTITCKNGKWSGKAIHPTCTIGKPKTKPKK